MRIFNSFSINFNFSSRIPSKRSLFSLKYGKAFSIWKSINLDNLSLSSRDERPIKYCVSIFLLKKCSS